MNEQDFARRVARHLDAGIEELPPSTLDRLRDAREAALAQVYDRAAGLRLADAAAGVSPTGRPAPAHPGWFLNRRVLAPLAALLFIALALLYWQQQAQQVVPVQPSDFADVDAEVLTDDLPVVAYLDPGFEIWLYHHTPASGEH